MKRERFILVKLNGARCVLDVDAMSVAPIAPETSASGAARLAELCEEGKITGVAWHELKIGDAVCR